MRLFAAIRPPEEVLDEIAEWWVAASVHLDALGWRELPRENWHLTLAFYGEVPGRALGALAEALEHVAGQAPLLELMTDGIGVFPTPSKPRVFWLGVEATRPEALRRLARGCMRALEQTGKVAGKRREKKQPFVGHMTLARIRAELSVPVSEALLREIPRPPAIAWTADEVVLYRSHLRPEGARYQVIETFPMGVEVV